MERLGRPKVKSTDEADDQPVLVLSYRRGVVSKLAADLRRAGLVVRHYEEEHGEFGEPIVQANRVPLTQKPLTSSEI